MSLTRANHRSRILQVQLFIQQHLDENLALDRLAEIAGYSPYHFHRVFRGIVGESTDDYVRRLRLERAAQSLRYRQRSVLDVALDCGYGSHEAFTRAFQRLFGVLPSEYQSLPHPPSAVKEQLMLAVTHTLDDVRLERLPPRRVAGIRVVGRYGSAVMGPAFQRIAEWASADRVWSADTLSIGVYHDDPEVTPPDKQRADACVTVGEHVPASGDVQIQQLAGGLYAVLRHKGSYDTLDESYRWLYSVWLPESGREPADAPPYEIYLNDCSKVPADELLTDICLPLAS